MFKFRWRGETDPNKWSVLVRLERNVDKQSAEFVHKVGKRLIEEITDNWSPTSPSAAWQPPAVESGNLNSAISNALSNAKFRSEGGQFASRKTAKVLTMQFAAADGKYYHGRGEYIQALELGRVGAEPRPFIHPAVAKLRIEFPGMARKTIKG